MYEHDGIVDGLRLHWRECGEGPPVALVHGIGVSGRYLLPTARGLAPTHRALVPDLPGFGRSPRPPRRLGIGGLADVLDRWLEHVEVGRCPLLANSFGCQVLVELAVRRPERVSALVLVGPTIDAAARSFPRQLGRLLADCAIEPPRLLPIVALDYSIFMAKGGLPLILEMLRDPVEERLPSVQAPALVVRGGRDRIVPQRWTEQVAETLPRGELLVIESAPHAVNYAAPEALAEAVRPFLRGL